MSGTCGPPGQRTGAPAPRLSALPVDLVLVSTVVWPHWYLWVPSSQHGVSQVARAAVWVTAATAANPAAPVVRLRQVAKTYRSGTLEVPALRGISLEIP